jgi:hypothetical protein
VHTPAELHVGVPFAQGPQAAPLLPHAAFAVPAAQRPPSQQPPLHGVSVGPPHAGPHCPVLVSHAKLSGQSAACVHPASETTSATASTTLASMPASAAVESIPVSTLASGAASVVTSGVASWGAS